MSEEKPCIHKCVCDLCDVDPEDCGYYEAEKTCMMKNAGPTTSTINGLLSVWFCSECGSPIYNDLKPAYCLYCGAKVVD